MRQPKPLTIILNGEKKVLKPFKLPFKELERVYHWLGRVLEWKEERYQKWMDNKCIGPEPK